MPTPESVGSTVQLGWAPYGEGPTCAGNGKRAEIPARLAHCNLRCNPNIGPTTRNPNTRSETCRNCGRNRQTWLPTSTGGAAPPVEVGSQ
eukprot:8911281-Lingulodinium_polyedra.AAC.1